MNLERLCPHCMGERQEGQNICPHCGKDVSQETEVQHQLKPFTILMGKYLVGDVIGEGGFGITYVGFDLNLETRVAIKEFYPNGYVTREAQVTSMLTAYTGQSMDTVHKWQDSFVKEARTLAKFTGLSGIVGVKDFFQENNTAYIIMEYLEGETLKSYMKSRGGKIPADELLYMMKPVIASLDEVHKEGLIHRDISPDNLMLLKGGQIKLLDFGAARDYTANGEKSLSVLLKPGYAPEEQYRTKGKQGPWSDVYALCATMYKCITGVTPPESMERMREDELKRPGELGISLSPQIENALIKGMAVFAEERCQSMSELYDMLFGQEKEQTAQSMLSKSTVQTGEKKADGQKAESLSASAKPTADVALSEAETFQGSEKGKDITEFFHKYQKWIYGGAAGLVAVLLFLFIVIKAGNVSRDGREAERSSQESAASAAHSGAASWESQTNAEEASIVAMTDDAALLAEDEQLLEILNRENGTLGNLMEACICMELESRSFLDEPVNSLLRGETEGIKSLFAGECTIAETLHYLSDNGLDSRSELYSELYSEANYSAAHFLTKDQVEYLLYSICGKQITLDFSACDYGGVWLDPYFGFGGEAGRACWYELKNISVERDDINTWKVWVDVFENWIDETTMVGKVCYTVIRNPDSYFEGYSLREMIFEEEISGSALSVEDNSIHRYELILADVTWEQAYYDCLNRGGYLARINTQEEFDAICSQILAEEKSRCIFWLGSKREEGSYEYYWLNENNEYFGDPLNSEAYADFWLPGEPSFSGSNESGEMVSENCLELFYRSSEGRFFWNDAPEDIIAGASFYAGRVGYICEYE